MQTIIGQMLEQYRADSLGEERNALKRSYRRSLSAGFLAQVFSNRRRFTAERRSASFTGSIVFRKIWFFL